MILIILDASSLYPIAKKARDSPVTVSRKLLGSRAVILDLAIYESINALLVEYRRGLIREPGKIVSALTTVASVIPAIRISQEDIQGIYKVARETQLTSYDAAYVYYARKYGSKLVTSDREILDRAGDVAINTIEWIEKGV